MAEDSEKEVPVSGGHEHSLPPHRPDDGEDVPVALGVCIEDGVGLGE